jgi:hypothetical protein
LEVTCYSNDLHDALLRPDGPSLRYCWRSQFHSLNECVEVDGCVDPVTIAGEFREHFINAHTAVNESKAAALKAEFSTLNAGYTGLPFSYDDNFIDRDCRQDNKWSAAGLDGITSVHLQFCFPIFVYVV